MALIKCPECGRKISEKAERCPNCGCPVEREQVQKQNQSVIVCPECGQQISESVGHCPNCGFPIQDDVIKPSEFVQTSDVGKCKYNKKSKEFSKGVKQPLTPRKRLSLIISIMIVVLSGAILIYMLVDKSSDNYVSQDLKMFELKGHVKQCSIRGGTIGALPSPIDMYFSYDGKLESLVTDGETYLAKYDSDGLITELFIKNVDRYVHFTFNSLGKVDREQGFSWYYTRIKNTYEKGKLKSQKRETGDEERNEMSSLKFSFKKFDKQGNWTLCNVSSEVVYYKGDKEVDRGKKTYQIERQITYYAIETENFAKKESKDCIINHTSDSIFKAYHQVDNNDDYASSTQSRENVIEDEIERNITEMGRLYTAIKMSARGPYSTIVADDCKKKMLRVYELCRKNIQLANDIGNYSAANGFEKAYHSFEIDFTNIMRDYQYGRR